MNTEHARAPETALTWFKSSYSGAEGGECVEVAAAQGTVCVRDTKMLSGPTLAVSHHAWTGLVRLVTA
ncbi:DUF397 domain-containing protein [Streptomyces triticagri]|uniref:DUF397 domain-containing protein n=1 Tax=Streptomyces triticagri TaxID=2293568 RepID=A0A372M9I2_9ACTN|nr:DUF397 domain-containing protein [Streptomyces triticagri]RFU87519.1 DUF397 domain-containing protein [Streptomyces triticagri]